MTLKESLLAIVNYPVPATVIEKIALARGFDNMDDDVTTEILNSDNYRLAEADIMNWTSFAPNISQGGVSFDMLYSDRKELREKANLIYKELEDGKYQPMIRQTFTYEGDKI